MWGKSKWSPPYSFNLFWKSSTWTNNKNKLHKTLNYWSSLFSIFSTYFMHEFSRKMFFMSYSINCPNFIVWLPLLPEMLGNMCIIIACFPGYEVMNFGFSLNFLMKPFFHMTKRNHDKSLNILRTKRAFKMK